MKTKMLLVFLLISLFLLFSACDKDDPDSPALTTADALSNYWTNQSNLTAALEARDGTMLQIETKIKALGTRSGKDAFTEIDALVETYVSQSNALANNFEVLIQAENAIIPYGDSKGILGSIAKGIYSKAKDTVVSSAQMVRSGWRVLSGKQTISQVVHDPNSGIPLVSGWADTIQKRNTARDALIREAILNWNPITSPADHADGIPYDALPGSTPQEKANAYLNLSDDSSLKMQTRSMVVLWEDDERVASAKCVTELGETGVKAVGDAYGGGAGEWTNEVIVQHQEEGQTEADNGTLNITVNQQAAGNPVITQGKTLIISKANMPADDPRITIIMNAPANLVQQLPRGEYNVIAVAEGYIRGVYENMQITASQVSAISTQLLKLAENAIVIENLRVDDGSITIGEPVTAHVSCFSTIGKPLSFAWSVSGGTYSGLTPSGTDMTFTPTEEKEYTITVVVSDDAGNSKTRSISVTSLGGKLVIDDFQISTENFADNKLNPGENATISLYVTNTGETVITGNHTVSGSNGVNVNFDPAPVSIPAGQTIQVNVPISTAVNFSQEEISLTYSLSTQNQNQIAAILSDQVDIPVDFYVQINPITELVTERLINISGKIANPLIQKAVLILDNDVEHAYDINVSNGNFNQPVVLSGSAAQMQHSVRVTSTSGALSAEATITFNSLIPVMALRATLTWDTNGTDVDFWITDPNGERCWYSNPQTDSGLTLDVDDTTGYGPENITSASIIPGDYLVQVQYFSDHDDDNAIGTNCVVVINKDENSSQAPVNYYGYLADSDDLWTVTTLHYDPVKGWSQKLANAHNKVKKNSLPSKH